jgi:hypothetical protein
MKAILILALLVGSEVAWGDPLRPEDNVDKYAHFGISSTFTASFITIGKGRNRFHEITWTNRALSSSAVLALGVLKEAADLREHSGDRRDSARDLVADAVGIAVGNLIHWEF